MANNKQRYINTRFWNDTYVSNLDPIEKLMFIYLLTNEHTNISGVYEVPEKIIAIETGIDVSMINKILPRIEDRIRYVDGFVVIKNFVKHQETGSELVQKGILNCLRDLDQNFLKNIVNKGFYELSPYYLDTLSIQYAKSSNYLDSNLDSNLDSITPAQEAKNFFKGDVESIFNEFRSKSTLSSELLKKEIQNFILYWTERNKSGTKQRWEQEKTFEVKRRLAKWLGNMKEFKNNKNQPNFIL